MSDTSEESTLYGAKEVVQKKKEMFRNNSDVTARAGERSED